MAALKEEKQGVVRSSSSSKLVQDVIASFYADKTWPTDVTLYTLPKEKELLPDVAQCHIIRALFACHGLLDCFHIERRHNAEFMAPKSRKMPFLRTESVYAYEDILQFMLDHNYVLKSDMNAEDRIKMEGVISLMETKLGPLEMYVTWIDPMNRELTNERYGRNLPEPLNYLLCWRKYTEVSQYLNALGILEKSESEIREEIVDIYKCISQELDQTGFVVGDEVTEADVYVFGHLQAISESKLKKNILMEELKNFPRLTKFCLNFNQIHMGNKAMIWEFL